jgi:hypothetical protein
MKKSVLFAMVLSAFLIAGCAPTNTPPAPTLPPPTVASTSVPTPVPATAPAPPATPQPSLVTEPIPVYVDLSRYIDNRSDPVAVVQSLYNAVNRKEYARAYSYWATSGAPGVPPFAQFEQGYSNTVAVQLSVGPVGGDAGAGNLWYTIPIMLIAQNTAGPVQIFVGCYLLHMGQPANYGVPPFPPMAIEKAVVQQVANDADTASLLAQACNVPAIPEAPPLPLGPTPNPGDIGPDRYTDDRSGPVEVLQSLYNAINRHEYVRAYGYWEPAAAAATLPPYPQFGQGYSNTVSVQLVTGQVRSDAGAGQLYYQVPATLISTLVNGTTQTFVGCYTLHLSQPEIQAAPPFQPLGVSAANIQQVANGADTTALMSQACP